MSERDELATVLESISENDDYDWCLADADALLAAGYRKPRIITTAEELGALPYGSVVLDADRATATKLDAYFWEVAGFASHFRVEAIDLPATVLHDPSTP